mmetsp:Transcript_11854/g.24427  ORF Transcript_11854/g.24427 Transcript_11854/m.24427 type:complete len:118 (+) Transcript_11854:399-752(+)
MSQTASQLLHFFVLLGVTFISRKDMLLGEVNKPFGLPGGELRRLMVSAALNAGEDGADSMDSLTCICCLPVFPCPLRFGDQGTSSMVVSSCVLQIALGTFNPFKCCTIHSISSLLSR